MISKECRYANKEAAGPKSNSTFQVTLVAAVLQLVKTHQLVTFVKFQKKQSKKEMGIKRVRERKKIFYS